MPLVFAHKIALRPNGRQRTYFAKAAGCARFAHNWALDQWGRQYAAWKADNSLPKPSEGALRRQLNAIKRTEYPWMLEVTKCAPQMAIKQLGAAFKNFFEGRAKYPRFHKKGVHDSFTLSNDQFEIVGDRIRIPNLGWVRMEEPLRFAGKPLWATVSRRADRWFVSVSVQMPDEYRLLQTESQGAVGVDLGVKDLATLSTGEKIEGPKPHKRLLKRIRRLAQSLSRKKKGSKNREKAKRKLARLHARVADIRADSLHKLTTGLTRRFSTIGVESLNVKGMESNRHLARSVADMGFFEFKRQLLYKAAIRGVKVVEADKWFPSSRLCSTPGCGYRNDGLVLSDRQWICPKCGIAHDRDVNAAINLMMNAVSSTVSACGEEGSGRPRKRAVKPASMKQEANGRFAHV